KTLTFKTAFLDNFSFSNFKTFSQDTKSFYNHLLPYICQQVWKEDLWDEKDELTYTITATFQGQKSFLDFYFSQCGFGRLSADWIWFVWMTSWISAPYMQCELGLDV